MLVNKNKALIDGKASHYRLKNLMIYECDSNCITTIIELAADSLEKLTIAKYY